MSSKVFIYTLSDPDTGEVKYVGQSTDPDMRMKGHIQEGTVTPKKEWLIDVITHRGKLPVMQVVDVVSPEEASEREGEWIRELNAQGELLNKQLINPPKEILSLDFEVPQGVNAQKWARFVTIATEICLENARLYGERNVIRQEVITAAKKVGLAERTISTYWTIAQSIWSTVEIVGPAKAMQRLKNKGPLPVAIDFTSPQS